MNHDGCPRAVYSQPLPLARKWSCQCGKRLAWYEPGNLGAELTGGLVPVPPDERHDGLPTYRLPSRVLRGRLPRNPVPEWNPTRRLTMYIICPVCETGQHLGD